MEPLSTERHLAAVAWALGAGRVRGVSPTESALLKDLPAVPRDLIREFRRHIVIEVARCLTTSMI